MNVAVPRSEAANSVDSDRLFVRPTTTWEQRRHMFQEDRREVVKRAYREFWEAKKALAALEAACVEISNSSSIMTEEGHLMLTPSGIRLLETEYVGKVLAQYHTARQHKDTLRKRLIDLGEPDPE
jgi:hypothetical protein